MKKLFTGLLALIAICAQGADVQWTISDYVSSPLTVRRIYQEPLWYVTVEGTNYVTGDRRTITNGTTGVSWNTSTTTIVVSNMIAGAYRTIIPGPYRETWITNAFPDTNAFLLASDYQPVGLNSASLVYAWSQAASDVRYLRTNITRYLTPGTNIVFVTNGTNLTIHGTATAASATTNYVNSQDTIVSNSLWSAMSTNSGGGPGGALTNAEVRAVTLNSNLTVLGTFAGDVSGGSNVNVTTATGTLPDARLSAWLQSISNSLPIYYVDNVNGSDANHGRTPQAAWASIAKAHTNLGAAINSVELRVYGNGTNQYREQLSLGTNATVRGYGQDRPIITASEVATGWSLVSGMTVTYAVSNFVLTGGGSATSISAIEDNLIMTRATTLANCESTSGTFYAPLNPAAGSTNTVFVHPLGDTDPATNGRVYEITKRNYAISGGDNNSVIGVVTRNQVHNNGSLELQRNTYVSHVRAENGTKHNFFLASGTVEDSEFLYACQHPDGSVPVVAYDTVDGGSVVFRRVRAGGRKDQLVGSVFYGHTGGSLGSFGRVVFEDCEAFFGSSFGSVGVLTNGIQIFNRCVARGVTQNGWLLYAGTQIAIDCEFLVEPVVGFSAAGGVFELRGSGSTYFISGLKASGANYAVRTSASGSSNSITILNSLLYGGNISATSDTSNNVFYVSNNVVSFQAPISLETGNTLFANSNCYPIFGSSLVNGTTYANWPAHQAGGWDANSVTNSMQWLGDPLQGNYTYASTSPAVTNLAGPGWFESPRLGAVQDHTAIRMSEREARAPDFIGNFNAFSNAAFASSFVLKTNGSSTGQTVFSPKIIGNWTNTGADIVDFMGINNLDFRLRKDATSHNLRLLLNQGGSDIFRIAAPALADNSVYIQTLVGNPLVIGAPLNVINFEGGGGGAEGFTFTVNSARSATVDPAGTWLLSKNMVWTNASTGPVGNGSGLTNVHGSNVVGVAMLASNNVFSGASNSFATVTASNLWDKSNVRYWGAKGDWNGTTGTDDSAAIQAAISWSDNGKTYIPKGKYLLTTNIHIPTGCTLIGEQGSALYATNAITMITANVAAAYTIKVIGLDFWGGNVASAIDFGGPLPDGGGANIRLERLHGHDLKSGITLRGAVYSSITDCAIQGTTNQIGVGLNLTNIGGVEVSSCMISSFSTTVAVNGSDAHFSKCDFWWDSSLQTNAAYLVHLVDARDNSFTDCTFEDTTSTITTNLYITASSAPLNGWVTARNRFIGCKWLGVNTNMYHVVLGRSGDEAAYETRFENCNFIVEGINADITLARAFNTSIINCSSSVGYGGAATGSPSIAGVDGSGGLYRILGSPEINGMLKVFGFTEFGLAGYGYNSLIHGPLTVGDVSGTTTGYLANKMNLFGTNSTTRPNLGIYTTDSSGDGVGGSIGFGGKTTDSGASPFLWGLIRGASDGEAYYGGHLSFSTYYEGVGMTEAMRITGGLAPGNVGIGTTSPTAKLDVNGTVLATAFAGNASGVSNAINPSGTGGINVSWDGYNLGISGTNASGGTATNVFFIDGSAQNNVTTNGDGVFTITDAYSAQPGSANLTNWSAQATTTKQNAHAFLTNLINQTTNPYVGSFTGNADALTNFPSYIGTNLGNLTVTNGMRETNVIASGWTNYGSGRNVGAWTVTGRSTNAGLTLTSGNTLDLAPDGTARWTLERSGNNAVLAETLGGKEFTFDTSGRLTALTLVGAHAGDGSGLSNVFSSLGDLEASIPGTPNVLQSTELDTSAELFDIVGDESGSSGYLLRLNTTGLATNDIIHWNGTNWVVGPISVGGIPLLAGTNGMAVTTVSGTNYVHNTGYMDFLSLAVAAVQNLYVTNFYALGTIYASNGVASYLSNRLSPTILATGNTNVGSDNAYFTNLTGANAVYMLSLGTNVTVTVNDVGTMFRWRGIAEYGGCTVILQPNEWLGIGWASGSNPQVFRKPF